LSVFCIIEKVTQNKVFIKFKDTYNAQVIQIILHSAMNCKTSIVQPP